MILNVTVIVPEMYNDLMKNHGTSIELWGYTVILLKQVPADYQLEQQ